MFLTWLPEAARKAGVDVYVMPGAETRSSRPSGLQSVEGVVWHHTATSTAWLDGHVDFLLRDGRIDLAGPLSQNGIPRDGTAVFVALGRANHNGYGEWGNDSWGLEFYNDGKGEPLTAAQIRTGLILTKLILEHEGLPASRTKAHRETDPRRKIDPLARVLSMDWVRSEVSGLILPSHQVPEGGDPDPMFTPADSLRIEAALATATRLEKTLERLELRLIAIQDQTADPTE